MKNEFWDKIKKMFQEQEQIPSNIPIIHEVIERSSEEQLLFEKWCLSTQRQGFVDWLQGQYDFWLLNPNGKRIGIDFLSTPSSKGFVLFFRELNFSQKECVFIFDFLQSKVLGLNYKPSLSDVRIFNRSKYVEGIHRHYLKPRIKLVSGEKSDQIFGNISVDLISRDDVFVQLKFSATTYNDQNYKRAKAFEVLMGEIFRAN